MGRDKDTASSEVKSTQSWMSTHVPKNVQTAVIISKGQSTQAAVYQDIPELSSVVSFLSMDENHLENVCEIWIL